jgi:pSer/pThr/pTyr-binding forkhead associated (FHA) protein
MDVKLVMFKSNGQRKDIAVAKKLIVIGRGENCDVQIPLENVSRRHCEISFTGQEVKVKDLASSNGTYVNNKRVNETALKAGDRLVVGPVVFTVQIDGRPGAIKPQKTRGERGKDVKSAGADEVVELEADVIDNTSGSEDFLAMAMGSSSSGQDLDPIAALEALAADGKKKKEKK